MRLRGLYADDMKRKPRSNAFLEMQPEFPGKLKNGGVRNQRVTVLLSQVLYAGYIEVPRWGIIMRPARH